MNGRHVYMIPRLIIPFRLERSDSKKLVPSPYFEVLNYYLSEDLLQVQHAGWFGV